jgi:hypothetical protein
MSKNIEKHTKILNLLAKNIVDEKYKKVINYHFEE